MRGNSIEKIVVCELPKRKNGRSNSNGNNNPALVVLLVVVEVGT